DRAFRPAGVARPARGSRLRRRRRSFDGGQAAAGRGAAGDARPGLAAGGRHAGEHLAHPHPPEETPPEAKRLTDGAARARRRSCKKPPTGPIIQPGLVSGDGVARGDMRFRGISCAALAAILVALAASGCGEAGRPADGAVLDRGLGGEPESLDPHRSRSLQANHVQRDLGEGLTGYSASGELEPRAAARWEISEDGRTYTFHLRPEARWSNGEPVTAADFVYSFRRLVNPETAAFYSQSVIDVENAAAILAGELPPDALGVSAPEPLVLVVRLERPTPYFLALLTHPSMFPVHQASVESGRTYARPGNFVTNGAYKLVRWDPG